MDDPKNLVNAVILGKCPDCSEKLKVDGKQVTCTSCGAKFLVDQLSVHRVKTEG